MESNFIELSSFGSSQLFNANIWASAFAVESSFDPSFGSQRMRRDNRVALHLFSGEVLAGLRIAVQSSRYLSLRPSCGISVWHTRRAQLHCTAQMLFKARLRAD